MESDFRLILTGHAPLVAIIPAARIHRVYYPQASANPAIRITKVSGEPGLHMQGSDGLTASIMQVDIRTLAEAGAATLVAVRNILIGAHGEGGLLHPYRGVVGGTDFRLISVNSDRGEAYEKPTTVEFLTASIDFNVWSRAAA